jgi:hypothetical protein
LTPRWFLNEGCFVFWIIIDIFLYLFFIFFFGFLYLYHHHFLTCVFPVSLLVPSSFPPFFLSPGTLKEFRYFSKHQLLENSVRVQPCCVFCNKFCEYNWMIHFMPSVRVTVSFVFVLKSTQDNIFKTKLTYNKQFLNIFFFSLELLSPETMINLQVHAQ